MACGKGPTPWVRRLYAVLLWAYPTRVRETFGRDMEQLFADLWGEEDHGRRRGRLGLWLRTVGDVLTNSLLLHLGGLAKRWRRRGCPAPGRGTPRPRGESMNALLQDIRYGVRSLRQVPVLTAVVVATLALGIGANTAIFSVVDGVLLRPLAFDEPEELVALWQNDRLRGTTQEYASGPDFLDFKQRATSYQAMAGLAQGSFILTGEGAEPERVSGYSVSHDLFAILRTPPALGRTFSAEEDKVGVEPPVLISHGLWQRRFGGEREVLGASITLDGETRTIIGVMPTDFSFPAAGTEIWLPLMSGPYGPTMSIRGNHSVFVLARLKSGVSLAEADAELVQIMAQLEAEYPDDNLGRGGWVQSLTEAYVGHVRPALLVVLGAVVLVLLIACANVAHILLSRAMVREREVAVRSALGAGRFRLIRQFLTESLLLSLLGGALGVGLAFGGVKLLLALGNQTLPRAESITIDLRVLVFTALVAVATGLVFGLVPALYASRTDVQEKLREGARGTGSSPGRRRLQKALAVAELTIAVVLVVSAGLLIRSFWRLQQVDPGFAASNLLTLDLQLPESRYPQTFGEHPNWPQVLNFQRQLLERVAALPGVESAAVALNHPLNSGWTTRFTIDGRPPVAPGEEDEVRIRPVTPTYFRTTGIHLVRGRHLTDADREDAPAVTLINQTLANTYFPQEDPVGQRITLWGRSREIVGVVADVRFRGLVRDSQIAMYPPLAQLPFGGFSVLVRSSADPRDLIPLVEKQVWALDEDLPIFNVATLESLLDQSVARPRFNMVLLVTFAALALVLAAVGIYGVISFSVSQRTHEIGLRMSLGARRSQILARILSQGLGLAALGIGLGLIGALLATRLLASLLYGVTTTDGLTFVAVALLLTFIALLASYIPARKASRLDPLVALRYE